MSRTTFRIPIMPHVVCPLSIVFVMMMLGGTATAADDARSEWNDDRWVPSMALSLGFTTQKIKGSVSSNEFVSLFGGIDRGPFRPPDRNQKYLNSIHVGGQFEMQSPALNVPHVHPRIIFGGEVEQVSSQSRSIAREGDPQVPIEEPAGTSPFAAIEILGRGSQTAVDTDNVQYGAHIGLSFPVQLGDWRVSIKPSARYLKQELQFTGIVQEARRGGTDDTVDVPRSVPTNVLLVQGSDDVDVHMLGPGLEIEIEAGGVRSLAASVFVSGGAYRVLSDRSVRFSTVAQDSNMTPFTTYTGTWTADIDEWLYRANVGFRVKWIGAGSGWLFGLDR